MSENINFIPANELPVAEGDEVSVLCLENGELKQKSASGLGGNTNYDIVVRIVGNWDDVNRNLSATGEIISGSFDTVVQKLDAGIMPIGLCIQTGQLWDGKEIKAVEEIVPVWEKYPEDDEGCLFISAYDYGVWLYPDGTVELD